MHKLIRGVFAFVLLMSVFTTPMYAETKQGFYYEYVQQGNETIIYSRQIGVENYDYQAKLKIEHEIGK